MPFLVCRIASTRNMERFSTSILAIIIITTKSSEQEHHHTCRIVMETDVYIVVQPHVIDPFKTNHNRHCHSKSSTTITCTDIGTWFGLF